MKTICQFCGAVIREGSDDRISHGICDECAKPLETADDNEFDAAWDELVRQSRLRKEAVSP